MNIDPSKYPNIKRPSDADIEAFQEASDIIRDAEAFLVANLPKRRAIPETTIDGITLSFERWGRGERSRIVWITADDARPLGDAPGKFKIRAVKVIPKFLEYVNECLN